jgi:hypothetical protein
VSQQQRQKCLVGITRRYCLSEVRCTGCQKLGHIRRFCPNISRPKLLESGGPKSSQPERRRSLFGGPRKLSKCTQNHLWERFCHPTIRASIPMLELWTPWLPLPRNRKNKIFHLIQIDRATRPLSFPSTTNNLFPIRRRHFSYTQVLDPTNN